MAACGRGEEGKTVVGTSGRVSVTPLVLPRKQLTKPRHEHHVYVSMWQNEKLNFVALILKLSSKLFLVQVFFRSPNHFHSS
jgi:hypothetical protein